MRVGSVNARLMVWFSRVSASRNWSLVASGTSSPPRSWARSARAPATTWIDARFLVPSSVKRRVPVGKSNAASPRRFGMWASGSRHRSRPAIIRWITSDRSPSSAITMRWLRRLTARTFLDSTSAIGGVTERSTNGLPNRTRTSDCPTMRVRRHSTYTVTSGSSGIAVFGCFGPTSGTTGCSSLDAMRNIRRASTASV
jgi:hypothetical protein